MFFVFDGIDGSGKSTQLNLFVEWLTAAGHEVVSCKDPGSTELGERLRSILLEVSAPPMPIDNHTEMMLFTTARTQLVYEVVRPALAAGKTVVLDRYLFSTVVYQGHAGDLDRETIWTINRLATGGLMPNATFLFDLPVEVAVQRMQGRDGQNFDRMESRGQSYFERVRQGFLSEADRWPGQAFVIDANRSAELIQQHVRQLAQQCFADIASAPSLASPAVSAESTAPLNPIDAEKSQ